jgi:hypothetical protein
MSDAWPSTLASSDCQRKTIRLPVTLWNDGLSTSNFRFRAGENCWQTWIGAPYNLAGETTT